MRDVMRLSRKSNSILRNKWWFLLPSFAGVLLFVLLPFGWVVVTSFSKGLLNYKMVLTNEAFLLAVKNTLKFTGIGIPLLLLLSFAAALGIYKSKYMRILKSAYLLPMAVPTAVVALIWKVFFHRAGIANQILAAFGAGAADGLSGGASFWVLIISYIWKNMGYTVVLWIAGIAAIPQSITEAARVDGANEWQNLRYMVLPQLKPVFYTVTMLSFLNSFKVFREAYLVAGSYPHRDMYLLQHLFNNWFTNLEIDKMSSAAVLLAVFFALCSLALQGLWEEEGKCEAF